MIKELSAESKVVYYPQCTDAKTTSMGSKGNRCHRKIEHCLRAAPYLHTHPSDRINTCHT
jgi:hypothetical protein